MTTKELSLIEDLRDMRDRLANELAAMPEHKRESRWHLDRHAELTRIVARLDEFNERACWEDSCRN